MSKRRKKNRRIKVAIDTETTGLSPWLGNRPFAVGMYFEDDTTKYWEWPVDPFTRMPQVDPDDLEEIKAICESDKYDKYFWNVKFDLLMLESIGVSMSAPYHEGMFMAKCCDNLMFNYRLKPMAARLIDIPADDEEDLQKAVTKCRRIAKKLGWKIGDVVAQDYWLPRTLKKLKPRLYAKNELGNADKMCEVYCVRDCERTIMLCAMFEHGMEELDVKGTYDFEMSLMEEGTIPMERRGVAVDPDRLSNCIEDCENQIHKSLLVLKKAAGRDDFNPGSVPQLKKLLFEGDGPGGLELPVVKKNKNGDPKVDAEALMPHIDEPVVEALFRYRSNTKAKGTFFDNYAKQAKRERLGHIMRVNWNQWGTLTGRFSSVLQLVPNPKTTNSKSAAFVIDVRQAFVPRRRHVWYTPDYSQVEVIIFADIAQEPTMLDAIRKGRDIHAATANKIWGGADNAKALPAMKKVIIAAEQDKKREGKPYEDYDESSRVLHGMAEDILEEHGWDIGEAEASLGVKIHRKLAKTVTFTKIFGGGYRALMGWLGCSEREARAHLRDYDNEYQDMVRLMKEIEREGKANGYVTNPFGRRLRIDPWYGYRAVNYLVQSAAADLMKRGMLKCIRMLRDEKGDDGRLIMTIHDELVFEFKEGTDDKKTIRKICELMSDHEGKFSVDTPVDVDMVDERWSIKKKVEL